MIRAGQMRHLIRIERRSTTPTSTGEPELVWNLVVERRCSVERAPGDEVWAAAGRNSRVPTMFRLRYEQSVIDALVAYEVRCVFNGATYDLASAYDPDGLRHEMVVTTRERVQESV